MSELNPNENAALIKMARYCAYQERCVFEVDEKLKKLMLLPDSRAKIIASLQQEGYLNQLRFAKVFARSKMHNNKWGKIKISSALYQKQVEEDIIQMAVDELDMDEYNEIIAALWKKKMATVSQYEPYIAKQKALKYMQSKGFSYGEMKNVIKDYNNDK